MKKRCGVRRPRMLAALVFAFALAPRLFAQTFPAGNWKDFSDGMIETPDTSMFLDPNDVPEIQPEPDYAGIPAAVQPELPDTPPTNYEGPIGVTGVIDNVTTGCSYSPLSHNALRGPITDIDVPGALGKYGLKMRRYYNSRSSQYWDARIDLSPGWFHEYSWLLWSNGYKVISPQGNIYDFWCGKPVGVSEGWDDGNQGQHAGGGIWRLADGGQAHFSNGGGADYIEDPYGLRTTITDDGQNRVSRVTEPGGRYLQFTYGTTPAYIDPAYGNQLLKKVEAYDGQGHLIESVTYTYTNVDSGGVDPITGQHVIRKMLTGVAYGDGNSASYTYRTDNVPNNLPSTFKFDPLLARCYDKRYSGPMHDIAYEYQSEGPHGAIRKEYKPNGPLVSKIEPDLPVRPVGGSLPFEFTETRGDGPQRTFDYTPFNLCQGNECGPCTATQENNPPQQMLTDYTDFDGNSTHIEYDPTTWYITSVTDANGNMTSYERGNPPSQGGIGEIKTITHPGMPGVYQASSIHYDYYPETGALGGHYLYHITDENGKITTIYRYPNQRIGQIDYPVDGNTPASHEAFIYNGFGQVIAHMLKNLAWETFVYDGRGLLTDKYHPKFGTPGANDPHTHYEYYTSGPWIDRVKTMTGPAPNYEYSVQTSETYEYDRKSDGTPCAGRGLVTKVTYADNRSKSFKYDQWGNKVNEWNELAERTDYVYDGFNRVKSVTRANETTTYDYAPTEGDPTQASEHTSNSPYWVTAPTAIKTHNIYDENWHKTSASVAGRTTWFHYDLVGNLQCVTDPRGSGECPSPNMQCAFTTRTEYDTRNRKWHVWDAQGHLTTFSYDGANNVIDILRPDNTHETKTYDAVNRVLTDTVPKDNSISITTTFYYNPSGTIGSVKDGENHHYTFEYNDPSDLRTKMTYPDNQSWQSWAYDDAHHMKTRSTVNGETEYFAYDNRDRKSGRAWENFSGEWAIYVFDAASRLRRAVNGGWQGQTPITTCDVHRDYDPAGQLTMDKQDIDGENNGLGPLEVHYEYDRTLRGTDGKPTLMYVNNLGDGYDYDFRYDEMGRFEKIFLHSAGNPWFQYHYDNASNETQRDNLLNHVNQIYNPDSLNRPTLVELQHDGTSFAREEYDYWPMGWLKTITRPNNTQDQFFYYYDGELFAVMYGVEGVSAPDPQETPPADDPSKEKTVDDFLSLSGWDPNAALTADRTVQYGYDKAGNRNTVDDSVNGTTAYTTPVPNYINQYENVGGETVTNGPEHEIASYKNVNYTYMKDEHLIRVTSGGSTYDLAYDALGRCVKRTLVTASTTGPGSSPRPRPTPHPRPSVPPPPSPTPSASPSPTPPGQTKVTKYYIYDGERPILEYDANGELAGYNLYGKGIDEILMRFDPWLPQTFYYQQDHEGNVTHLTYNPPAGQTPILEYYRYDVFGKATIYGPPPNWSLRTASLYSNRFLFTGREYNAMFGFYEYRARAYHPGLGRFMSEDPKLFDTGDYNLFGYCHNDPIDFTDPMGLDAIPNGDGTYHFVLRSDVVVSNTIGGYVVSKSDGTARQCAGAAQFLTGTRMADGTLHDAPRAGNHGWSQGGPLAKETPDGTMVARGWKNGFYPNESPEQAEKNGSKILNHTGIKVGWDDRNQRAIIVDQNASRDGSLQKNSYDPKEGDWSIVNAKKPYDPQASRSDFKPAIQKDKAAEHTSNVLHSKPDPSAP